MNSLKDVLALDVGQLHVRWSEIDKIIGALPSRAEQIQAWEQVCEKLEKASDEAHSLKGHPYFRLGALHLLENGHEQSGLRYFELAYKEDQKSTNFEKNKRRPEERAAYRLLTLTKDFFEYLHSKKPTDWETTLLFAQNRKVLIPVLLTAYDFNILHTLDMGASRLLIFNA